MVSLLQSVVRIQNRSRHVFVYLTYGRSTVSNHMDIVVTRLVTRLVTGLVTMLVIYLYLRLISCPDTFSPGDVQCECQNVQIILSSCPVIWSLALHGPELHMEPEYSSFSPDIKLNVR